MDLDESTPTGQPTVSREKTAPFLIRTFVKIGSFHRLTLFEDGTLPTTDEQQLFTWKDATLREVLTTLRNTAPHVAEYRHPLARFSFRTVYADPSNKGRFSQKDIGMVYSRDILGEPGLLNTTAPRLLQDIEPLNRDIGDREREERNLEELRFIPGDFLLVAVLLPKNVTLPSEIAIKGSGAAGAASGASNGWRASGTVGGSSGKGDGGWGRGSVATGPGFGRGSGGGHWRGDSNAPTRGGRGGGGRGGGDSGRDRDLDRNDSRIPPPRRSVSPPPRGGWGDRDGRGGRGGRRSPSRSRSPPRRRNRYD
ncbi:Sin3 associated polypeptide p18-domain-containing protein [Flammula alnicola]|nr:Sin3 associated polypeptide p18-domain-containing protein [Flammula alnicola]